MLIVSVFGIFVLKKSFFELMQNKTEYCNLLVSRMLPIIYRIDDNYFIFSQIENESCFAVYVVSGIGSLTMLTMILRDLFMRRNAVSYCLRSSQWGRVIIGSK